MASGIQFDVLFGPAYKGIPLAAATACALAEHHQLDVPYAYNRKEKKDHGEGGLTVGAPLQGRVLIVDDVITAGTAVREVMALMQETGATPAGILVALDRQERGQGELSAIQEIERDYHIPVISLINLTQIIDFLKMQDYDGVGEQLRAVRQYRQRYGV